MASAFSSAAYSMVPCSTISGFFRDCPPPLAATATEMQVCQWEQPSYLKDGGINIVQGDMSSLGSHFPKTGHLLQQPHGLVHILTSSFIGLSFLSRKQGEDYIPISETHTKNQFANEPEGLRQFRDQRWKALGKDNSDLPGLFFCDHFLTS